MYDGRFVLWGGSASDRLSSADEKFASQNSTRKRNNFHCGKHYYKWTTMNWTPRTTFWSAEIYLAFLVSDRTIIQNLIENVIVKKGIHKVLRVCDEVQRSWDQNLGFHYIWDSFSRAMNCILQMQNKSQSRGSLCSLQRLLARFVKLLTRLRSIGSFTLKLSHFEIIDLVGFL